MIYNFKTLRLLTLIFLLSGYGFGMAVSSRIYAQSNIEKDFSGYALVNKECAVLAQKYANSVCVKSEILYRSPEGDASYVFKLSGRGILENKPAVILVGGIDGRFRYTVKLAIDILERFVQEYDPQKSNSKEFPDIQSDESSTLDVTTLLDNYTLYIIPNASPVALSRFYNELNNRKITGIDANYTRINEDRDARYNEDVFNDLDNDSVIRTMRFKSLSGKYLPHPDDHRVLIPADYSKNQRGLYHIITEGFDDDGDRIYNEDGDAGVSMNRNFSFDHSIKIPYSGLEPISEPETRALIDFLTELKNINVFFTLGGGNNLSTPWVHIPSTSNSSIITSPPKRDNAFYELLSKNYLNEVESAKNQIDTSNTNGDFLSWAYYHFGRYSIGSPAWFLPKIIYKNDSTLGAEENRIRKVRCESDNIEVRYLYWLENLQNKKNNPEKNENSTNPMFSEWKKIPVPENEYSFFPEKFVEVGGLHPLAYFTPPLTCLDSLAQLHFNYTKKLLSLQPLIRITHQTTEKLTEGSATDLYRITVDITNVGALPTQSAIGEKFAYVPHIVYDLFLPTSTQLISGFIHKSIPALQPGETAKISWIVKGKGIIRTKIGAPNCGFVSGSWLAD